MNLKNRQMGGYIFMEKNKKKKIDNKLPNEIIDKIFYNILIAIILMIYFFILNIAYNRMALERLEKDIQIFAGFFMIVGLFFLEKSYKKDDGLKAIRAIEFLIISFHSLAIMHVIKKYKFDFQIYLATCSYIFAIYYTFKSIIIYTKGRKQLLNSLSDVKDIVKKEEPVKKEATKKHKIINNELNDQIDKIQNISKLKSEISNDKIKEKTAKDGTNGRTLETVHKVKSTTEPETKKRKTTRKTKTTPIIEEEVEAKSKEKSVTKKETKPKEKSANKKEIKSKEKLSIKKEKDLKEELSTQKETNQKEKSAIKKETKSKEKSTVKKETKPKEKVSTQKEMKPKGKSSTKNETKSKEKSTIKKETEPKEELTIQNEIETKSKEELSMKKETKAKQKRTHTTKKEVEIEVTEVPIKEEDKKAETKSKNRKTTTTKTAKGRGANKKVEKEGE